MMSVQTIKDRPYTSSHAASAWLICTVIGLFEPHMS